MNTRKNHAVQNFVIGLMTFISVVALNIFNFGSTQYALNDLLGEVETLGHQWATILALVFCLVDFAGIAGIFTPEKGKDERRIIWYLGLGWFVAASLNAGLTWWGIGASMINRGVTGNALMPQEDLLNIVPKVIALLVWLVRVCLIISIVVAFDNISVKKPAAVKEMKANEKKSLFGNRKDDRKVVDQKDFLKLGERPGWASKDFGVRREKDR